ncbi:Betaine-aldehyde dehydrogenase [Sphingobium chlorophenolicum L-1]|uniref:aldehyde dehydrogenase (NAD(+)) n=1 Tax=Sphingobium chlorophenolicum L-1 TaxID=690566 RepID=F6F347_SPHCR|nr:aldehyde dehydrogenase [Sphingobium chlorophenolicum]AEG50859.1 Betaine-aldehyde dehydrogenase [Sphingobium chlorophenolicum L-1]
MTTAHPRATGYSIGHRQHLFIGGEWRRSAKGGVIDVISPTDELVADQVAAATPEDIDLAVTAAREAFDQGPWPHMAPSERAATLRRVAANLRERLSDTAWATTLEMGAPLAMARTIATRSAQLFDDYAEIAETHPTEDVRPRQAGGYTVVVSEPVGVVAAIVPWNGPALLTALKVAPALAAGCTVVLKPAPETPLDAYILAECIEAAGVPPGVFNLVVADREASDRLIRHPGIDKVSFTGSTAVGKHILEVASQRVLRVSLELGGKSAAIVLDDANMETVVAQLAGEVCTNTGQVCASLTRMIVPRGKMADYAEALGATVSKMSVGDPFQDGVQVGPLAMGRQRSRVEDYIRKGVDEGAQLVSGGRRPGHVERGFFIEPTVFSNVSPSMTIAREEIFGPVASIIAHDGPEDAVRIANDTRYGLHGAVFTEDPDAGYRVARQMQTGSIGFNRREIDWSMPFGGFKESGLGREGGREGYRQYIELKSIYMPQLPSRLKKQQ